MAFAALVEKQDRNQIGCGKEGRQSCSCLGIHPAELESPWPMSGTEGTISERTLDTECLQPRTSSHCLLLSGSSEWARRIKSREPLGGTMSDLRGSLEVKDGGQNGQSSEGRGLPQSAWASMVLMCRGGRL